MYIRIQHHVSHILLKYTHIHNALQESDKQNYTRFPCQKRCVTALFTWANFCWGGNLGVAQIDAITLSAMIFSYK